MADFEQLKLLRLSVSDWNAWRQGNPMLRPDLRSADLESAKLAGANLNAARLAKANLQKADCRNMTCRGAGLANANLSEALLDGSDFTGARASRADFEGASLKRATLDRAVMYHTKFDHADLSGVRMRHAVIHKVSFSSASLNGVDLGRSSISNTTFLNTVLRSADLTRVNLQDATFTGADLSQARGLDTVRIAGKCNIDKDTRRQSAELSLQFLYNAGYDEKVLLKEARRAITISFRRDLWAQLLPIEHALASTLGDKYSISKRSDCIKITLADSDLFQAALDAVLPVLASLHVTAPGEITNVSTDLKGVEPNLLNAAQIQDQLAYLVQRFDHELPPERRRLTAKEELTVKMVENGFRGLVAEWLRRWFERPNDSSSKRLVRDIYTRFKRFLFAAKDISALPSGERPLLKQHNEEIET